MLDETSYMFDQILCPQGMFRVRAYRDTRDLTEPLAIICGGVEQCSNVVCRVHDQCFTSEVLGRRTYNHGRFIFCLRDYHLDFAAIFFKDVSIVRDTGSLKCDCQAQLEYSMDYIQDNQPGLVIYLPQVGLFCIAIALIPLVLCYCFLEIVQILLTNYFRKDVEWVWRTKSRHTVFKR